MKTLNRYYIVDVVAESVVGGFDAPSETLALRVFNEMLEKNENLKKYPDSFKLCVDHDDFVCPETFSEVLDVSEFVS